MNTCPEGVVMLCVDLKVRPSEMRHWKPETIRAFFDGLAMVQSAATAGREHYARLLEGEG